MGNDKILLDSPIEIKPGVFKPLGQCTGKDLEAAAFLLQVKAEQEQKMAALHEELAKRAKTD